MKHPSREDFTIVGRLVGVPEFHVHLARFRDDTVELVELVERLFDDDDGYASMYAMERRNEELRRLVGADDARLPRLLERPFRSGASTYGAYAHTPSISFVDLDRRAAEIGGLAVPLVVSLAIDLLEVLALVHGEARAHGDIMLAALAATLDGGGRFVTFEGRGNTLADVADLGRVLKRLATGAADACDDDHVDALELREDLPWEFTTRIEAMVRADIRATDALDALVRDVSWARWTKAQVADELRALFPERAR